MNENGKDFLMELQLLCKKYNVSIFAGMFGLKFHFWNKDDDGNHIQYWTQNTETKEFTQVEDK